MGSTSTSPSGEVKTAWQFWVRCFSGIVLTKPVTHFINKIILKMDSGTLIVGAIMIVICILPFILINNSIKKQKKQLLQSLSGLATQQNCKITQHELGSNLAIGMDENADFLFFFRRVKDKEIVQHIDLKDIQNCKVLNTSRTVRNSKENYQVTDKLELCVTPKAKSRPDILLEFYNSDENSQLDGELQLIEKWTKIINDKVKK